MLMCESLVGVANATTRQSAGTVSVRRPDARDGGRERAAGNRRR